MSRRTDDLSAIFDRHIAAEFVTEDLEATMATMAADPFVNHVPTMMGGAGTAEVAEFYGKHMIGHWLDDTTITPVAHPVGTDCVVDEMIMSFTHDIPMDTFLPGLTPTGRAVRLPVVVVMGFEGDKVGFERIYWDQASLLVQIGLLDPARLPVTGAIQADKVLDKDVPANQLIHR